MIWSSKKRKRSFKSAKNPAEMNNLKGGNWLENQFKISCLVKVKLGRQSMRAKFDLGANFSGPNFFFLFFFLEPELYWFFKNRSSRLSKAVD